MIESLISSKMRIKLLIKFFLNSNTSSYLRGLEGEFGESTNAIRIELNRLEKAGMLISEIDGNKKRYRANTSHPLFPDVHSIVMKYTGLSGLAEYITRQIGEIKAVYLTGAFARGLESEVIDLVLVGDINRSFVAELVARAEKVTGKKIRYLLYHPDEFNPEQWPSHEQTLELWRE